MYLQKKNEVQIYLTLKMTIGQLSLDQWFHAYLKINILSGPRCNKVNAQMCL